jgi:hypothetical protein
MSAAGMSEKGDSAGSYTAVDPATARSRLAELLEGIASVNVEGAKIPTESHEQLATRYLVANNWKSSTAEAQLKATLAWREAETVDELRDASADTVLGCSEEAVLMSCPMWYTNSDDASVLRDAVGRPIFVYSFGRFRVSELLALTDAQKFLRYVVWRMEQATAILGASTSSGAVASGNTHDGSMFSVVVDLHGFSMWSHVNSTTLAFVKMLNTVGAQYYPETLAKMFIINTPLLFRSVWAMVCPLLDAQTVSKITLLGAHSTQEMLQFVDVETLLQLERHE